MVSLSAQASTVRLLAKARPEVLIRAGLTTRREVDLLLERLRAAADTLEGLADK